MSITTLAQTNGIIEANLVSDLYKEVGFFKAAKGLQASYELALTEEQEIVVASALNKLRELHLNTITYQADDIRLINVYTATEVH